MGDQSKGKMGRGQRDGKKERTEYMWHEDRWRTRRKREGTIRGCGRGLGMRQGRGPTKMKYENPIMKPITVYTNLKRIWLL